MGMQPKRTQCQCDISGSPKQWCQRHQCYKNPIQVRQCQVSVPNFVAWEDCRGAGQNKDCVPVPIENDERRPNISPSALGDTQSYINRDHRIAVQAAREGCSSCSKKKNNRRPPDTSSLETEAEKQNAPSAMSMGWNFVKAVGAYVKSGLKDTDEEQYAERLRICDTCEWRTGGRCMKCGCFIDAKARWASSDCPIGKWPKGGS